MVLSGRPVTGHLLTEPGTVKLFSTTLSVHSRESYQLRILARIGPKFKLAHRRLVLRREDCASLLGVDRPQL